MSKIKTFIKKLMMCGSQFTTLLLLAGMLMLIGLPWLTNDLGVSYNMAFVIMLLTFITVAIGLFAKEFNKHIGGSCEILTLGIAVFTFTIYVLKYTGCGDQIDAIRLFIEKYLDYAPDALIVTLVHYLYVNWEVIKRLGIGPITEGAKVTYDDKHGEKIQGEIYTLDRKTFVIVNENKRKEFSMERLQYVTVMETP